MRRGLALLIVALIALPAQALGRRHPQALARRHRIHRPPGDLPRALAVDEKEWAVTPSQTVVSAGKVTFNAYNRGEDEHDFVIANAAGNVEGEVSLRPGSSATVTAHLGLGRYVLFCSLFFGTPESHYARGMHATLTVR